MFVISILCSCRFKGNFRNTGEVSGISDLNLSTLPVQRSEIDPRSFSSKFLFLYRCLIPISVDGVSINVFNNVIWKYKVCK